MNNAAAVHGGQADADPVPDLGFMYARDLADPDDRMRGHSGWIRRRSHPQPAKPRSHP
jgi:hypothetical protein